MYLKLGPQIKIYGSVVLIFYNYGLQYEEPG